MPHPTVSKRSVLPAAVAENQKGLLRGVPFLRKLGRRWRNTAFELTDAGHDAHDPKKKHRPTRKESVLYGSPSAATNNWRDVCRCLRNRRRQESTLQVEFVNQTLVITDFSVHWLLSLSWPGLIVLSVGTSLLFVVLFVVLFAGLFFGLDGYTDAQEAFAISTQTFLTIG